MNSISDGKGLKEHLTKGFYFIDSKTESQKNINDLFKVTKWQIKDTRSHS